MKLHGLRQAIALSLSAGMVLAVPAVVPQFVPQAVLSQAEAAKVGVAWDFKKDLDGWKYGGKWAYKGKPEIEHSSEFGGTVRLGVDFSQVADSSWSEVKLEYGAAAVKPLNLAGTNVIAYDFYFQPKNMTGGQFKTKVYAKDASDVEVMNAAPDIDLSKAKDVGKGWKVVHVAVQVPEVQAPLSYLVVSVVGSNTDYKGDLFVGHLRVSHEAVADGYVDVTTRVQPQAKLNASALPLPSVAPLVDKDATQRTAQTYAMLKGIAATQNVVYGHQDEMNRKVSTLPGRSDTYDIVQDYAGIVGVDGLALTGDELELTDAERAAGETYASKLARLVLPAVQERTRLLLVQD